MPSTCSFRCSVVFLANEDSTLIEFLVSWHICQWRQFFGPLSTFWCLANNGKHTYSDNKSDVSIVSNEKLPRPLCLDKPSRVVSGQLATGLLLWTFQMFPVCVHLELRKWHWLNVKELITAPVLGVVLVIVPECSRQVLPHRFFSRMVGIIRLPPQTAFVERRKWCRSVLSKQLHEKCR